MGKHGKYGYGRLAVKVTSREAGEVVGRGEQKKCIQVNSKGR